MKITEIIVVLQDGSKHFTAYTDLPSPVEETDVLTLNMFIPGDWESYVNNVFPNVPVKVIDARTNVKRSEFFKL